MGWELRARMEVRLLEMPPPVVLPPVSALRPGPVLIRKIHDLIVRPYVIAVHGRKTQQRVPSTIIMRMSLSFEKRYTISYLVLCKLSNTSDCPTCDRPPFPA